MLVGYQFDDEPSRSALATTAVHRAGQLASAYAQAGRPSEAYEAEFELKQGSEEQLRSCVARIAGASGWTPAASSKFQRGLEAAGLA